MRLGRLWMEDFRGYHRAHLALPDGVTVIAGGNGTGKTSVLEAIAYLALRASFRGVPTEALVRAGCARAVVRGEAERSGRTMTIEAELARGGRGRVLVNGQPLRRADDLPDWLRVSVFSPDDLALVKGGPGERRRYLDDVLVALHPRHDRLRRDLERVLRQRNALLGQTGGRLTEPLEAALAVWDAKLVEVGEALAEARHALVERLAPAVAEAYRRVAGGPHEVEMTYDSPWRASGLAAALKAARPDELRRRVSLVGPHRDDLALSIDGLPARTHASQGEQRSLALALRLAAHATVGDDVGEPPVLLLDDVFSELDGRRADAVLAHLPAGQAVLTTTGPVPDAVRPAAMVRVDDGRLVEVAGVEPASER